MTVKELRKQLKKFPSDMPIATYNHDWEAYTDLECEEVFKVRAKRHIDTDENGIYTYQYYDAVSIG